MPNNADSNLIESLDQLLQIQKLDFKSLPVRQFVDASFATNHDHTLQVKNIVSLFQKDNNACVAHHASCKSGRVAGSVLGAEKYSFSHVHDFAFWVGEIWNAFFTEMYHSKHM